MILSHSARIKSSSVSPGGKEVCQAARAAEPPAPSPRDALRSSGDRVRAEGPVEVSDLATQRPDATAPAGDVPRVPALPVSGTVSSCRLPTAPRGLCLLSAELSAGRGPGRSSLAVLTPNLLRPQKAPANSCLVGSCPVYSLPPTAFITWVAYSWPCPAGARSSSICCSGPGSVSQAALFRGDPLCVSATPGQCLARSGSSGSAGGVHP